MPRKKLQPEEKVIAQKKPLHMSLAELKDGIQEAGGDFRRDLKLKRIGASVRLVIRCKRADRPASWAMAVLFNDERIDGIDHEVNFDDRNGEKKTGHHRHHWDAKARTCKRLKEHLPNIDISTLEAFILDGLKLLHIELKEEAHASIAQLSID